nr:hypothetical protein [Tanacetum cinerariifolium]
MANLSEDIQCGKENEVNILKSIDEGLFWMGTLRKTLTEGTEGALHLGPERPRVYFDLKYEENDRYNIDIRATNILLQGLPKDIYSLINHYTDAKDIWDNVKMLLEGVTSYRGAQNKVGYANLGQARQIKCYNCNGISHLARNCTQPKRPQNLEYFKDKMLLMQAQENGVALDEEQLPFIAGGQDNVVDEDVDEQPVQDLTLNVDNVFQADDCDAFDSVVDEAPTAQTMFMANLSFADPFYNESGPSYDSDILSEVHDHDHYQDAVCKHHGVHEMHDDVQPNYVVDSHSNYTSDSNMIPYDQYVKDNAASGNNVVDKSLTAELATYKEQVELYKRRARFELTIRDQKIDEQLRIVITDRNIKEENLKKELHYVKMQLQSTINHNKSMVEEVTNNRKVHLDYLKHLKESVETIREIVEEAKVERPLDRSLASACLYTKHSQELLEYVIGTCPKDFNKLDKKQATTPLTKKKQVTFVDQCETSNNNPHKHVEQQTTRKTYVPMIPSTGVNSCIDASGSKPRSNTKKNRISPATSVNRKILEDHTRTNKSNLQKTNRVNSSISSKRTVINSNSDSVCQTCNKCFILANHDMCMIKGLPAAKPPSWWRSDDGTPPQPHLVASSCDAATLWGVSRWYMLASLDGTERGYRMT